MKQATWAQPPAHSSVIGANAPGGNYQPYPACMLTFALSFAATQNVSQWSRTERESALSKKVNVPRPGHRARSLITASATSPHLSAHYYVNIAHLSWWWDWRKGVGNVWGVHCEWQHGAGKARQRSANICAIPKPRLKHAFYVSMNSRWCDF